MKCDESQSRECLRSKPATLHSSPFTLHHILFALVKRAIVLIRAAEEHLDREVGVLNVVVALGVVTFRPDTQGDLLGR